MDPLEQFFGGYFHQDCFEDDPTWQNVVNRFCRDTTPEDHAAVARQIEAKLLGEGSTEEELSARLSRLGSFYDPTAEGYTYRRWLIALVTQLKT